MAKHAALRSLFRTEEARAIDALVIACMAGVALFGMLALSAPLPSAPAGQSLLLAEARTEAPETAPAVTGHPPQYFPWKAPEPYVPVLPERAVPDTRGAPAPGFLSRLRASDRDSVFRASTHNNDDSFYGANWREENIVETPSGTLLSVKAVKGQSLPFTAGEIHSREHYGYGRYEAIMRPARGSGLVSAFFTYTGPWHGNPHDEIDIEFLGKDTTKIHFNYFRKGKRGQHATFDLPFDAADADRLYAFEWTPEGITWFVDGVPYYATEAGDPGLPQAPGMVIFSAWTGKPNMSAWHGRPDFGPNAGAHISCSSFVPLGQTGRSCADEYAAPVLLSR